jgi:gliding motility-associated-like protein
MRALYTLLFTTLILLLTASLGLAQCPSVNQGSPVASSACFQCPFPATGISGNNAGAPPTFGGSWCTSIENDQFIGFTAICNSVQFAVQVANCNGGANGDGLQMAIVDADFNLFNCISGVANGSTYNATLPSCGDYYIRLDGISGSACDYTISPISGVLDDNFTAPTTPATISGPTFLCANQSGQYQISAPSGLNTCLGGANICSSLCWDISYSSPLLASEVTATPTDAFGFGCTDNMEQVVDIMVGDLRNLPSGTSDTIFLSATPDFACAGPGTQSEVIEIIVSRPPDSFDVVFACPGEEYFFDGTGYGRGSHIIGLFDAAGCPFDLRLTVQEFPPNFGPTLPLALCGTGGVTICPSNPIVNPAPGLNTCNLGPIASNGCDSLIQYDVYYLDPEAVINANATELSCTVSSIIANVNPGSTEGDTVAYNWTTTDGTFSLNNNNRQLTARDIGTYYLEVSMWSNADPSQTCDARDTLVITSQASNTLDTPMVAGPLDVCIGSTASYSTVADPTINSYNWTAAGSTTAFPSNNTFDVVWTVAGTYEVCLSVSDMCGPSDQRCIQVTVTDDQPSFTLEGSAATCRSAQLSFGITPFDPMVTYTVTGMPFGATAVIDNDSVRVTLASNSGDICVTGQGTCGAPTQECATLIINGGAAAPQIFGPTTVCAGAPFLYRISNDPTITQIEWTITGGRLSSSNTSATTVIWTAGTGQELCVEITDDCGLVQQECIAVNVNQGPTAIMSGGGRYCEGNNDLTVQIDFTGQAPFTFSYLLGGASQTLSSNVSPFVISMPDTGNYILTGISDASGCMGTMSGSAMVAEDALPTATLGGAFDICANAGDQISFDVTLTGTGPWDLELALDNAPLTPVTVTNSPYTFTATTAGTYTVSSVVDATTCAGTSTGSVVVTERQPLSIVSVRDSCLANNGGFIVMVELANGDVATYQNTGLDAGGFSGNVFTSDPLPSGSDYSFLFSDQFGCSPQTVSQAIVNCDCTNSAGTMARDTMSLCGAGNITLPVATSALGSTGEVNDALAFYLHTGSLGALQGVLDSAFTPSFTFDPARYQLDQVYYISAVSADATSTGYPDLLDPCLDVSLGQPIVWRTLPTAQINAVSDACTGDEATVTILLTGSFPLTLNYTLGGVAASQTFAASPASLRVTVPARAQPLALTNVIDAFGCMTSTTSSVVITPHAEVAITGLEVDCGGTGQDYTVSFTIASGDVATATVLPAGSGTLTGNVFISNPIPAGAGYSFTISDANACNMLTVAASTVNCNCVSMTTPISQNILTTCGATPITAAHSHAMSILDADDGIGYIVHSSAGSTLGTVFSQSPTPTFNIDLAAGMTFGTVYYISPIVGNSLANGRIDLADPCLSIAAGTPVVWEQGPTADLQGENLLCEGESARLTYVFTGSGPFTAKLVTSDGARDTTFTTSEPTISYLVSPIIETTYVLTEVSTSSCTIFPNDSVRIGVDQLLTAGTVIGEQTLCANDNSQVALANLLNGADVGGLYAQASGPSAIPLDASTGTFENTDLVGGQYEFTYTIGSGGVCPTEQVQMIVNLTPSPVADAGVDQMLTCDETLASLGGPNTSSGTGISYAWTGGPVADPTAAQTTTTVGGVYTLTVTDAAGGCQVSEEVVIDISSDRPNTVDVIATPADCDGGATGAIFVGNVRGGIAPYRYSLNGSAPTGSGDFSALTAGDYTLLVTDAMGCAYQEDITVGGADAIEVSAGPDLEVSFGESETIQLQTTGAIESIFWNGGPFECVDSNSCDEIIITPTASTFYEVTVVDSNGCEATDALQVIVRRDRPVFVPTAFSPNGDLVNDIFFLRSPEGVVSVINSFQVFDRWGETVFRLNNVPPNDPSSGWNGVFAGEFLNSGTYVYLIEVEFADGVTETIKGDFSLIR